MPTLHSSEIIFTELHTNAIMSDLKKTSAPSRPSNFKLYSNDNSVMANVPHNIYYLNIHLNKVRFV